jgi:hypothetical protein
MKGVIVMMALMAAIVLLFAKFPALYGGILSLFDMTGRVIGAIIFGLLFFWVVAWFLGEDWRW